MAASVSIRLVICANIILSVVITIVQLSYLLIDLVFLSRITPQTLSLGRSEPKLKAEVELVLCMLIWVG